MNFVKVSRLFVVQIELCLHIWFPFFLIHSIIVCNGTIFYLQKEIILEMEVFLHNLFDLADMRVHSILLWMRLML